MESLNTLETDSSRIYKDPAKKPDKQMGNVENKGKGMYQQEEDSAKDLSDSFFNLFQNGIAFSQQTHTLPSFSKLSSHAGNTIYDPSKSVARQEYSLNESSHASYRIQEQDLGKQAQSEKLSTPDNISKSGEKQVGVQKEQKPENNLEEDGIEYLDQKDMKKIKVKESKENLEDLPQTENSKKDNSLRGFTKRASASMDKVSDEISNKTENDAENNFRNLKNPKTKSQLHSKEGEAKSQLNSKEGETDSEGSIRNNSANQIGKNGVNTFQQDLSQSNKADIQQQKSSLKTDSISNRLDNPHTTSDKVNKNSRFDRLLENPILKGRVQEQFENMLHRARVLIRDQKNASLTTNLHPKELGQISLKLTLLDGNLNGFFTVESDAVQKTLLDRMDKVLTELKESGYNVSQFEVNVRSENQSDGKGFSSSKNLSKSGFPYLQKEEQEDTVKQQKEFLYA